MTNPTAPTTSLTPSPQIQEPRSSSLSFQQQQQQEQRKPSSIFHEGEIEFQKKANTFEFANALGPRKITGHVPQEFHHFLTNRMVVYVASYNSETNECWCSAIWASPRPTELKVLEEEHIVEKPSFLKDSHLPSYMEEKDYPWIPLSTIVEPQGKDSEEERLCSLYDPCNVASGDSWLHLNYLNAQHFEKLVDISQDGKTLRILKAPHAQDPMWQSCREAGTLVSLNFLDLESRKRYRTNGILTKGLSASGFEIQVCEAFSTCPKYIQQRAVVKLYQESEERKGVVVNELLADRRITLGDETTYLSEDVINFIVGSDTMMIATIHKHVGADCSHRGGRPGFIRVLDRRTLVWGDYVGKGMFQTLGNTVNCPNAGLLFVDFENGHLLHLTGDIQILWREPGTSLDGSDRTVLFHTKRWMLFQHSCPFIWQFVSMSSHNPLLNDSNELEKLNPKYLSVVNVAPLMKKKHQKEIVHARLERIIPITDEVKTFGFKISENKTVSIQPGQYATFTLSLEHPYMRSWTVSSAQYVTIPHVHTDMNDTNYFEISVKKQDLGATSTWLHDHAQPGDELFLMGIEGNFTLQTSYYVTMKKKSQNKDAQWKVLFLSGGIGITPFISMIRGVSHSLKQSILTQDSKPQIVMIHSEKLQNEIPFRSELENLLQEKVIDQLLFCVTREKDVKGELIRCQRLDKKIITDTVKDIEERVVYICGPGPFNESMIRTMQDLNVHAKNIVVESFDY
ncbi:hypothetical protein C9374_008564 [Naegleria lovaniensis]|uniref:FAD-binding FR-type domain-containing protein n=1 Tax=Naegleria lovaniensis TaxID=51637 RepID=A0AA88GIF1_NAELO|nr:uncharacterized protein C9374_008564 [Naegleria lovaniensis]KAG2377942.1 hypothetical protein C9374_008564 [Naegleria lovaniensis]